MIENELEKRIKEKLTDKITELDYKIQIIGFWEQTTTEQNIKGEELEDNDGIIVVKVMPRSYETFTQPYALIPFEVSMVIRQELDTFGKCYRDVVSSIMDVFGSWQKSHQQLDNDLSIDNKFDVSGFRIDDGDCGYDGNNQTWQYSQRFTISGIII